MIDIRHALCGGLCFRYDHVPLRNELLESDHAVLLDGTRPIRGQLLRCGTCGELAAIRDLIIVCPPNAEQS